MALFSLRVYHVWFSLEKKKQKKERGREEEDKIGRHVNNTPACPCLLLLLLCFLPVPETEACLGPRPGPRVEKKNEKNGKKEQIAIE